MSTEGRVPVCSAFWPLFPGTCDFSFITSATGRDLTWICSCILDLVSCKRCFMLAQTWFSFTLIYVKQDFLLWSVYNTYNLCSSLAMAPFSFLLRWDTHDSLQWLRTGLDELAGAEFWIWGLIIGIIAPRITALSVSLSLLSSGQSLDLEWMFHCLNWDVTCTVKCADLKYTTQWVLTDDYTHVADTVSKNISSPIWYFYWEMVLFPSSLRLESGHWRVSYRRKTWT